MRLALLLASAVAFTSTGCAALVAQSGIDPESLTSERIEKIGTLESAMDDHCDHITFRTYRKIAEPARGEEIINRDIWTPFGVAEVVELPYELFRVARTTFVGREVEVYYWHGFIESVAIDGDRVFQRRPVYSRYLSRDWKDAEATATSASPP